VESRIGLFALALACGLACTPGPSAPTFGPDDAAVEEASRRFVALVQERSPETATALGLHARDEELDDRTPEGFERTLAREEAMLAEVRSRFAGARLSRKAQTDLALLESALAVSVKYKRARRPLERQPDYFIPLNAVFQITARAYAPAKERATKALARIAKMPAALAIAERTLKSPPKIWTQVGIESARGAIPFLDEQRRFLDEALPDEKPRIEAIVGEATRAFERYADFLEHDVLPRSTGDFAAGTELFEWLLREDYFLDARAGDLDALGRRLIAQTQAEMEKVARRIDPNAPVVDVVARAKANHGHADDLLADYRREVLRARRFILDKDAVPLPPGDDCEVIETPGFLRTILSAAYDGPPPFDRGTRGFFFVTPIDRTQPPEKQEEAMRENDHGEMVDTAVHETYPGHHVQLSFARRHPSIIRRVVGASIFSEGWGLYSEELMNELGYYTDEERLMELDWVLVRAVRVVVDVGLHTKGMTFEQAVDMLASIAHVGRELATGEVKRYTLEPTQPLSYLVGREMIFRLRERYRAREGSRYSLKRFHEELLSHGSIPPGLIEREMF
jgi:uncharacterized protein (DUF885 family)